MNGDQPHIDRDTPRLIAVPLTGALYMVRMGYVTQHGGGAGFQVWSKN